MKVVDYMVSGENIIKVVFFQNSILSYSTERKTVSSIIVGSHEIIPVKYYQNWPSGFGGETVNCKY